MGFIGKYTKSTPQRFEPGTSPKVASFHNGLTRVATKISPNFVQIQPRSLLHARARVARARPRSKMPIFVKKMTKSAKHFALPPNLIYLYTRQNTTPALCAGGQTRFGREKNPDFGLFRFPA